MPIRSVCLVIAAVVICGALVTGARAQELTVARAVVCRDVVDRTPVDVGESVPAGSGRVFCFTWIKGAVEETVVTHNWYYQGALKASVTLPVRSASWRTWSSKSLLPEWTGDWMVEILSKEGIPLENIVFSVQ